MKVGLSKSSWTFLRKFGILKSDVQKWTESNGIRSEDCLK